MVRSVLLVEFDSKFDGVFDSHIAFGGKVSQKSANFVPVSRVGDDFVDLVLHVFLVGQTFFFHSKLCPQFCIDSVLLRLQSVLLAFEQIELFREHCIFSQDFFAVSCGVFHLKCKAFEFESLHLEFASQFVGFTFEFRAYDSLLAHEVVILALLCFEFEIQLINVFFSVFKLFTQQFDFGRMDLFGLALLDFEFFVCLGTDTLQFGLQRLVQ